jgi:hypothetical protein
LIWNAFNASVNAGVQVREPATHRKPVGADIRPALACDEPRSAQQGTRACHRRRRGGHDEPDGA